MQDVLRGHLEKIISLTDEEFAFIEPHFLLRKYKKHQFLIQEGMSVKYVYFVVSGLLKLVHTDDSGKQQIISFALEDWWESDYQAFYTQSEATFSLDCVEDSTVLCLSLESYQTLCASLPKMEHFFLEKANRGYMALQRRLLALMTTQAQERYEQLLKQHPALVQRVPKTLLASYLGVSRETLSRFSA